MERSGGLPKTTLVMGILNVTPDSFSDGGRFDDAGTALAHARAMFADGADIIDIGGESTRPGHQAVDAETEKSRVVPVVAAVAPLGVPVSIDTMKADVAEAALAAGATILNDVWGFQRDPRMAEVAATAGCQAIVMHNRDKADPSIDIMEDMLAFFDKTLEIARKAGVKESSLVLDPGIGFGKTAAQSLQAMRHLARLKSLGFPILFGASRKSTIGHVLDKPVDQRLFGTLAVNAWAVLEHADIIRVHDVAAHVDFVRMLDAIRSA
ncbi:MAG: dihydropteroate synthase [Rhodobiaceae bacterium]|nr:dihydropteroate synthase [Rhodobiaceae bacterium]MCC0055717.1 dihydropteroate synthase [Rhodobiaceae bacterium]